MEISIYRDYYMTRSSLAIQTTSEGVPRGGTMNATAARLGNMTLLNHYTHGLSRRFNDATLYTLIVGNRVAVVTMVVGIVLSVLCPIIMPLSSSFYSYVAIAEKSSKVVTSTIKSPHDD